ncbi:MAG: HIT family protein [Candidatus Bathyarchaeia archaeon]
MKFDDNCIFCKIVQKQAPSSIIYEDDYVMAFLDIRPVNEGHALVVPKEHYECIYDIPSELLGKVHEVSKKVALAVKKAVKAEGISIIQQNERAANQDIFHLHVHVIPRYSGQKMKAFHELQLVDAKQLDLTATKIKPYM